MPGTRDQGSTAARLEPQTGELMAPAGRRPRWRLVLAGVIGLLALCYVAGALLIGDRIPRDATVAGVPIGGRAVADAEATLDRELAPRADQPVAVSAADRSTQLVPSAAGITLDTAATVAAAGPGNRWNPLHLVTVLTGGGDVEPVPAVDTAALSTAVTGLAAELDVEPVDGAVAFVDGTVEVEEPVEGVRVDVDAAADVLAEQALAGGPVDLPAETAEPAVDADDVQQAVQDFAEPAMSGPVTVVAGDTEFELAPADLAPYLRMEPVDGALQPAVDTAGLIEGEAERFAGLVTAPVDAHYVFENDAPKLVPGVPGTAIDLDTLAAGLMSALPASGAERVAEATVATELPELTTEELQALGIVEEISEFTTEYPITSYRLVNIPRAANLMNGTIVMPGETFSMNETVGERTAENGFVEGIVIQDGKSFESLGGGVSQVATTTFNAVFFAGLEDVEHKPHSFYISRYPAGREATVSWPDIDLKFRNDSGHGVLIQTLPDVDGVLTVRFWGTKVWDEIESVSSERYNIVDYESVTDDSEDCVPQGGSVGFDITVTRNFINDGAVVRSEDFVTHYNPADDITCI